MNLEEQMIRNISIFAAFAAVLVFATSASAHVIPANKVVVNCAGITGYYSSFPAGDHNLTATINDFVETAPGKGGIVPSSVTVTVHGRSGSFWIGSEAPKGTTSREVTLSWDADGGGTTTVPPVTVSCGTYVAPPTTTTVYVNVPGPTQYVNVPGPVQYVNVPGPETVTTKIVRRIVHKIVTRWRKPRVHVDCPKGTRVLVTWMTSGSDVTVSCTFPKTWSVNG